MPRGKGRGRRVAAQINHLKHAIAGVAIKTRPDPPMVTYTPWNSMTLVFRASGDFDVVASSLRNPLKLQSGLNSVPDTIHFDMRIMKVRVWVQDVNKPLRVHFYGIDAAGSVKGAGAIKILEDFPGALQYAHVGYVYPSAYQSAVYNTSAQDRLFSVETGDKSNILMYVDLLWRGSEEVPFTVKCDLLHRRSGAEGCVPTAASSFSALVAHDELE